MEDTTEDSVMIVEATTKDMVDSVTIVDTTEDMVIVSDDSVKIVETVTVEDTVVIDDSVIIVDTTEDTVILIDDSVKIVDTVTVQNVVEDCVTIDIDDSSDSSDSYTSDRSRSTKYMSECPIHNHHMDGTWESICPDDGPCNCM